MFILHMMTRYQNSVIKICAVIFYFSQDIYGLIQMFCRMWRSTFNIFFNITRQYRKLALKGAFTGTFYTKPVLAIMQKMDFFSLAFYISCRDEKLRLANISFQFCHRATKPAEQKKLYSIRITSCITVSKMVKTKLCKFV